MLHKSHPPLIPLDTEVDANFLSWSRSAFPEVMDLSPRGERNFPGDRRKWAAIKNAELIIIFGLIRVFASFRFSIILKVINLTESVGLLGRRIIRCKVTTYIGNHKQR
jgi:hypothetical protein